jgi:hypothetical protein
MLRVIIRFLGLMLLAAGFAAVVIDGARSIASNALVLTSLGETLSQLAPAKYPLWQATIEKKFGAWAWDPVATTLLALPNWLVAGAFGALLFLLTRRRRPQIGYVTR